MNGKTMDIVAENVGKLNALFPEAFTEGKVDFEVLKEVLGTFSGTVAKLNKSASCQLADLFSILVIS